MTRRPVEILLAEADVELAEMLVRCLADTTPARITHVTTAADALREELTTRHDLLMVSESLSDGGGLGLVRALRASNKAPAIWMVEDPTVAETIAALRLGVVDVLTLPFDLAEAAEAVKGVAQRVAKRKHRRRRYRRLRRMSSRIVRERRDLRQRMDLICRDLVQAYRGLAEKVAESGVLSGHVSK